MPWLRARSMGWRPLSSLAIGPSANIKRENRDTHGPSRCPGLAIVSLLTIAA